MYDIDAVLDGIETATSVEQRNCETICKKIMKKYIGKPMDSLKLARNTHIRFLTKALDVLPARWTSLDSSRTWFVYWITNSLACLDALDHDAFKEKVVSFIKACSAEEGGYGGGPQQLPHLAATYAAISALAAIGGEDAYNSVDRSAVYKFLMACKHPLGGFTMHIDGECDTRAGYCATAIASLLGIVTEELLGDLPQFVARSQNWEGGIGGEPGTESHGGFTFCGLASVAILSDKPWEILDLPAILNWTVHRQMGVEGGFQGRTNKLVDACYSWWNGVLCPILHRMLAMKGGTEFVGFEPPSGHAWMNAERLQHYVLQCCQDIDEEVRGGIRDKPGKKADFYHSCYGLGGFAASQHWPAGSWLGIGNSSDGSAQRLGPSLVEGCEETNSCLTCPHLLFNVDEEKIKKMHSHWAGERVFTTVSGERGSIGKGVLQSVWNGPTKDEIKSTTEVFEIQEE